MLNSKIYNESYLVNKAVCLESANSFFENLFSDTWNIDHATYTLKNDYICYGSSLYSVNNKLEQEIFCNGSRYYECKNLPHKEQLSKDIFLHKETTKKTLKLENIYIFNKTNNWSNKFFHFLTDVLLKVQMLNSNISNTVLLTSDLSEKYLKVLIDILTKLNFEVIMAEENVKYMCYNSYLLSSPVDLYGHISKSQLIFLQNLFNTVPAKKYEKIYLARRSSPDPVSNLPQRDLLNADMLNGFLKVNNFKFVYPDEISIEECSSYIRGAKYIIGVHGSQLSNIIFANKGTRILEILPENYFSKSLVCYRALSCILELNYAYINGLTPEKYFYSGPRFKDKKEVLTSNMLLTEKKLNLIYKDLLQTLEQGKELAARNKTARMVF